MSGCSVEPCPSSFFLRYDSAQRWTLFSAVERQFRVVWRRWNCLMWSTPLCQIDVSPLRCPKPVIRFLQGKEPKPALRIGFSSFLPEVPRYAIAQMEAVICDILKNRFWQLGLQDNTKYWRPVYQWLIGRWLPKRWPVFEVTPLRRRLAAQSQASTNLLRAPFRMADQQFELRKFWKQFTHIEAQYLEETQPRNPAECSLVVA